MTDPIPYRSPMTHDEAHGGALRNGYLTGAERREARRRARCAKSWDLTARQLCDLELLLNGAFSPLDGFMSAAQYRQRPSGHAPAMRRALADPCSSRRL